MSETGSCDTGDLLMSSTVFYRNNTEWNTEAINSFFLSVKGLRQTATGSPDKLCLGVDVSDAIFGQALVHAVEERPQQAPHHAHQDKEGQVHCGPQVAVLIPVWTLISRNISYPELNQTTIFKLEK